MELLGQSASFLTFVDEIFAKDYYFSGLDYQIFHNILYSDESLKSKSKKIFLAKIISALPTEKKSLYDKFKIKDDSAFYEFGPIPVKGPDNSNIEITLTFDELVAAAWTKHIRFGLHVESIKQKISNRFQGMSEIAKSTVSINGEDAKLEYLTRIEKDLTPLEDLKTGSTDLKRYKCTFPQILDLNQNKIVRKIRATEGVCGHYLNGEVIPSNAGRDLNLNTLAGEGTVVIIENETEYIAANRIGYIIVNPKNGKISVTPEVQNHSPIGPETGSLEIKADQFNQYDDILNGYSVKCNNIRVEEGNVNGEIISVKGRIEVKSNVNSGRLIAQDGIITVAGIVTMNAYLESLNGDIVLETAENSTLIGENISVQFCVNCNVVGENIKIVTSQSNKIVGLSVVIENSEAASKTGENTEIIIPILELTDKRVRVISHILEEKKTKHAEIENKIKKLKENKLLLSYLEAVKAADGASINPIRWNVTPIMHEINRLSKESGGYKDEISVIERNLNALKEDQDENINKLRGMQQCTIEKIQNDNIKLKLYGGLDWPLSFERIVSEEGTSYKSFMTLIESLTKGFSSYKRAGCIKIVTEPCSYDHFALQKMFNSAEIIDPLQRRIDGPIQRNDSGHVEQRESRVGVISEEDFKYFLKERKWLPRKQGIEVTVDGIFTGYIHDFSTSELSMLLEKAQKWRPDFEKGEKIKLIANLFGSEFKYDLIIAYMDEKSNYIRVGGYFININSEDVDKLYKLKNRFEVLLKSY